MSRWQQPTESLSAGRLSWSQNVLHTAKTNNQKFGGELQRVRKRSETHHTASERTRLRWSLNMALHFQESTWTLSLSSGEKNAGCEKDHNALAIFKGGRNRKDYNARDVLRRRSQCPQLYNWSSLYHRVSTSTRIDTITVMEYAGAMEFSLVFVFPLYLNTGVTHWLLSMLTEKPLPSIIRHQFIDRLINRWRHRAVIGAHEDSSKHFVAAPPHDVFCRFCVWLLHSLLDQDRSFQCCDLLSPSFLQ